MKTADALRFAQNRDLDLVEVAPDSKPPVYRILDYSKYKYEQAQRQKAARKHQTSINIREIKFRPKIGIHDYETKKGHVERFLKGRDKVKVTIMFRGREVAHPERGVALLDRFSFIIYLFGAFLIFTAFKMVRDDGVDMDPGQSRAVRLLRKVVPVTDEYQGQHFLLRRAGKMVATPLLAVLVAIETADVLFAFDSVPAALGVKY